MKITVFFGETLGNPSINSCFPIARSIYERVYIHKMEHVDQKRYKIWRYVHIRLCSVHLSIWCFINGFGHFCCNNQQTAMRYCCPMIGRRCHIVCLGYPCCLPIPPSMSSESLYPMICQCIHSYVCSLFLCTNPLFIIVTIVHEFLCWFMSSASITVIQLYNHC